MIIKIKKNFAIVQDNQNNYEKHRIRLENNENYEHQQKCYPRNQKLMKIL